VFAVVLWLVVVNIEDPDKTKAFSIPVTIENADYLTGIGKTYEILGNSDKVSIMVTGKRSIIQELSESDFTATANMENINDDLTMVPITITASRYSGQIEISRRDSSLEVSVENLVTDSFEISTVIEGNPASSCYVEKTQVTPEKVTVTGPQSVVEQIATAQVTVNVNKAEEDIATNGEIVLLDNAGDEVSQERLSLNRTTAAVDISIRMEKTVPLQFKTTGEPAEGYRFAGVSSTVSSVKLTGAAEVLDSLNELEISSDGLNIDGATTDCKTVIRLASYLPDGVSLADGEPEETEVTVTIEGQTTRSYEMPVENITVEGLSDSLNLSFDSDSVTVNLSAFVEDFDGISASSLKGKIDASSFAAGTYQAEVMLQGDYQTAEKILVSVTVTENNTEDNGGSTESGGQSSSESGGSDNGA
jgi:YbbR domain-containing protein